MYMTHPLVSGRIEVEVTRNATGTRFFRATTPSGLLVRGMLFVKGDESAVLEQVYWAISQRLS